MRIKVYIFAFALSMVSVVSGLAQTKTITISSEPNATVWVNDIRYGATDESGKLAINLASAGAKRLRVRADGFKETTQSLLPTQKGEVKIALAKTTDEAEIAFQQAEVLASTDREKAVEMYKKAVSLRPKYMDAQLGMARALSGAGDTEAAIAALREAKKWRPGFAEISAVEGRTYAAAGEETAAIAAFKRAIAEGKGFQPEAHTGLGTIYRSKAEEFAAEGDFENEKANYLLAAAELKKAVAQLSGAPDAIVVYQLLGDSYERAKMFQEAINVYEEFLRVFPDADEATMVRSFIVQAKKQMSEQ